MRDDWWDDHEDDGYQGNGKALFAFLTLTLLAVVAMSWVVSRW